MKTISRITENADIWALRLVSDGHHQISFRKFCSSSQACRSPIRSGSRQQPWTLHGTSQTSVENPTERKEITVSSVPHLQCRHNVSSHLSAALDSSDMSLWKGHSTLHQEGNNLMLAASTFWLLALQVSCCLQPPLTAWDMKLWSLAHSWCSLRNPFLSIPDSNYSLHSGKCWSLCSVRVEQLQHRGNDHLRGVSYWEFEILSSLLSSRWVKSKSIRWYHLRWQK